MKTHADRLSSIVYVVTHHTPNGAILCYVYNPLTSAIAWMQVGNLHKGNTNMQESQCDPANQPRQNKELVPKRRATHLNSDHHRIH